MFKYTIYATEYNLSGFDEYSTTTSDRQEAIRIIRELRTDSISTWISVEVVGREHWRKHKDIPVCYADVLNESIEDDELPF